MRTMTFASSPPTTPGPIQPLAGATANAGNTAANREYGQRTQRHGAARGCRACSTRINAMLTGRVAWSPLSWPSPSPCRPRPISLARSAMKSIPTRSLLQGIATQSHRRQAQERSCRRPMSASPTAALIRPMLPMPGGAHCVTPGLDLHVRHGRQGGGCAGIQPIRQRRQHDRPPRRACRFAVATTDGPERQAALDDFYRRFEKDALVIDKVAFTLQAMIPNAGTLAARERPHRTSRLLTWQSESRALAHRCLCAGEPDPVQSCRRRRLRHSLPTWCCNSIPKTRRLQPPDDGIPYLANARRPIAVEHAENALKRIVGSTLAVARCRRYRHAGARSELSESCQDHLAVRESRFACGKLRKRSVNRAFLVISEILKNIFTFLIPRLSTRVRDWIQMTAIRNEMRHILIRSKRVVRGLNPNGGQTDGARTGGERVSRYGFYQGASSIGCKTGVSALAHC